MDYNPSQWPSILPLRVIRACALMMLSPRTVCPMSALGHKRTLDTPEVLKSRRRQLGVAHGALNVAVAEVSLQRPRVVAFVGQRVAAGMPQHVRVRLECEFGLDRCPFHHAGEPGSAERCPALRGEHEGRLGLLLTLAPS